MRFRFKKAAIIGAIGLLGLAGSAVAFAQHRGGEHRLRWVEHMISSKLDLNDEQREKLAEVKRVVLEAKKKHHAEREAQTKEIEELILSDQLDEQKIQELMTAHRDAIDEAMPDVLAAVSDFHGSLTDEQKQKAVEAVRAFHRRHHD